MAAKTADPIYRQTLLNAINAIEIIVPMHIEAAHCAADKPGDPNVQKTLGDTVLKLQDAFKELLIVTNQSMDLSHNAWGTPGA